MRMLTASTAVVVCFAAGACCAPVAQYGFEDGVEGWKGFIFSTTGAAGEQPAGFEERTAEAVTDAEHVKVGQGALGLSYEPGPGRIFALTVPDLSVAGCRSVRFWAKSTTGSVFLLAVTEKDGSSYHLPVTLVPGMWHEIGANLSDFGLDENGADENGVLDVDQIANLVIADAAGFLGLLAARVPLLDIDLTPRAMYVDEVIFESDEGEGIFRRRAGDLGPEIVVGDFETDTLTWAFVGTGRLDLVRDKQLAAGGEGCLKVTYDLAAAKMAMLMPPVVRAARTPDMYSLRAKVKCSADCTLIVQLAEDDESKYNKQVELSPGDEWADLELAFDEFELEENGADENGELDPDQIKSIGFINATALLTNEAHHCELWLDEVSLLTQ